MSNEFLDYVEDILDAMEKRKFYSIAYPMKTLLPTFVLILQLSEH